jgi:hypothetical protein
MTSCDYYAGPYLRIEQPESEAGEMVRSLAFEDIEAFDSDWVGQFREYGAGQNKLWLCTHPAYHRIVAPTEELAWPEGREQVFDAFEAAYRPMIERVYAGLGIRLVVGFGMLPLALLPTEITNI